MKRLFLTTVMILLVPTNLHAEVVGGSNLGIGGYPSNKCAKPNKPAKPDSFNGQDEIEAYNSQIQLYNSKYQEYVSCINEYITNGNNDAKRIKERAQDAVDEANK